MIKNVVCSLFDKWSFSIKYVSFLSFNFVKLGVDKKLKKKKRGRKIKA